MELGNQQERREADLTWLGGFWDGEGSFSILVTRRPYVWFTTSARLVSSDASAAEEVSDILRAFHVPHHVSLHAASKIGSRQTKHIVISGMKRCEKFIPVISPYLRVKGIDAGFVWEFIQSRRKAGKQAPYSDYEIDCYIELRNRHGYRLHESSETIRQTLLQGRYSPISARKTERAAEMTAPAQLSE